MSIKLFNFNNEASDITIDVNDETGVVSIPALQNSPTYSSIDAFAEEFAVSRGIQSEDLKNWKLISNLDTYYFVQKKATGGLDTDVSSQYISLVHSLVDNGATQMEIIQMLQKENIPLEDIIDIYNSATTSPNTDTTDTDEFTEVDEKTEIASEIVTEFLDSYITDLPHSTTEKLKKLWFVTTFEIDETIYDLTKSAMISNFKDTFKLEELNDLVSEKKSELETQIAQISEQFKDNPELLDINKRFLESKINALSVKSILSDEIMTSVTEYINTYNDIIKTKGLPAAFVNAVYGIDPATFESAVSSYKRAVVTSQISGKQHGVPIVSVSIYDSDFTDISIEHLVEPSEFIDIIDVNGVYIGIKEHNCPPDLLEIFWDEE